MADTPFKSELYNPPPPNINEENIIDDTIFELAGEDEIDTLFRLYDKLKDSIDPGKINKVPPTGVPVDANNTTYKTHAYLVANSVNYLTGDSAQYSPNEIEALLLQNDTLRNRIIQLNEQLNASVTIINSFGGVLGGMTKSLTDFMMSGDNITKYSPALQAFIGNYESFNNDIVQEGINAFLVENQKIDLKTFNATPTYIPTAPPPGGGRAIDT